MNIGYIWEHNGNDTLIYFDGLPGAFVRGKSKEEALSKAEKEAKSYMNWAYEGLIVPDFSFHMIQEYGTNLAVSDADSEVIFESEKKPLTEKEYIELKKLTLKSAADFQALYDSIPDKNASNLIKRKTFYGSTPVTAKEMYEHTKSVNSYYFGEIGIEADNEPDIYSCREKAFEALEAQPGFLKSKVYEGSYGEQWSLRKLFRRFIWHDRIHAKAMWRMGNSLFGNVENVLMFED